MPPAQRGDGGKGRGRGGKGGGRGRGETVPQPQADAAPRVDAPRMMEHPIGIIISSHSPPKGIRFTINKELFEGFPGFEQMPDRILGEIDQWIARREWR